MDQGLAYQYVQLHLLSRLHILRFFFENRLKKFNCVRTVFILQTEDSCRPNWAKFLIVFKYECQDINGDLTESQEINGDFNGNFCVEYVLLTYIKLAHVFCPEQIIVYYKPLTQALGMMNNLTCG